ncbi:IS66 family insertion sequence element accessory protein TnpA, partial [Vibrio navarrensis]
MSLSPDTWFEHIQAWMQTQQTQVDYCRHHGLTPHQFTYWKQKY